MDQAHDFKDRRRSRFSMDRVAAQATSSPEWGRAGTAGHGSLPGCYWEKKGGAGDLALGLIGGWEVMRLAGDGKEQLAALKLMDNLLGASRNNVE
jgi:hypothetical protein